MTLAMDIEFISVTVFTLLQLPVAAVSSGKSLKITGKVSKLAKIIKVLLCSRHLLWLRLRDT